MVIDLDTRANHLLYNWIANVRKTCVIQRSISLSFAFPQPGNIKIMLK